MGRSVVVEAPKSIDGTSQENIHVLLDMMEQEILSGQDLTQSTLIDVDSWVKKYIIDEISANVDSDRASCYFYYLDGKFFAGPIWDYDLTSGNAAKSFYTGYYDGNDSYKNKIVMRSRVNGMNC